MTTTIEHPYVRGSLSVDSGSAIYISTVAYEHPLGIPARFYAGLLPAIALSKKLQSVGIHCVIRIVDPTSIANYCNNWQTTSSKHAVPIYDFLEQNGVSFFFDNAEEVKSDSLQILESLSADLKNLKDEVLADIIQRIQESGRKHGGESGAKNALLYMAAHPFSWLDMYHPAIWKKTYPTDCVFVNLMSKSEERFAKVREFLKHRRPDLINTNKPIDLYTRVCDTPCYIPLDGEPLFTDLMEHGYSWCYNRYREIKKRSSNHERAYKDFRLLMSFLGLNENET